MAHAIDHVLLAVTDPDGSRSTLPLAAAFAAANGARLSVLLVDEPIPDLAGVARMVELPVEVVAEATLADRLTRFEAVMDGLELPERPDVSVRVGTPFVEIIRHVVTHAVDMVIKAPDARGGLLGNVLTSTDQHLLRKCPGIVWLSDAAPRGLPRSVVLAVDVDDGGASEPATVAALNERLLGCARAIAAGPDAELHLVHLWDAPGAAVVEQWSKESDPHAAAERYAAGIEADRRAAFAQLEAQLLDAQGANGRSGIRVRAHFLRGSARQQLPELTRRLGAEVLVMGTTARTSVPGLIIGNTAEDVLNSVDCGVLTVKPPSFTSPISADD